MSGARREWYFDKFEHRRPPPPSPHNKTREFAWQVLGTIAIVIGFWYIQWRWSNSLNLDALWFAVPLVMAETLAFVGLILSVINLWQIGDTPLPEPPATANDIDPHERDGRPIRVDVFIATYSEDPELVRLSIQAAKALRYSYPIDLRVHVLDDGRRPDMQGVTEHEGADYITRQTNVGYKAGNLRNAIEMTDGDLIVICDADTRLFPTFLNRTMGYFRDPKVAWVQTPQWFFDTPEGERLDHRWRRFLGRPGGWIARGVQTLVGEIRVNKDPYDNDPRYFYDVIQRRRNPANASFCCGAASIHRREAVLHSALRAYADAIERQVRSMTDPIDDPESRDALDEAMRRELAFDQEVTPFKFHVSEDIYTSIILHGDPDNRWRSVYHPEIQSKMLSPQDLKAWAIQRFKYCAGTLDIGLNDSPIYRHRLSLLQRLMYGATIWSYLGALWSWIFLVSPAVYLFTGIPPVSSFSLEFFVHFLPFILAFEIASLVGTWGVANPKGKAIYTGFFPIGLRALWTVLRGQPVKFHVTPKERQSGRYLSLVRWHIAIVALNAGAIAVATVQIFFLATRTDLAGYIVNLFWATYCIMLMVIWIRAALWHPPAEARV